MLPDRVSNPGPLTYESGALPIALSGPACFTGCTCSLKCVYYIYFSDPNSQGLPLWPVYDNNSKSYMDLTITSAAGKDLYADRMKFWIETIPNLIEQDISSAPKFCASIALAKLFCILVLLYL